MTAEQLLKSIQLSAGREHGNDEYIEKLQRESKGAKDDKIIQKLKMEYAKMPTNYQDSHFYDIIIDSFEILKDTVENENFEFEGRIIQPKSIPLFGTADLNGCNAFIATEDSDPVIVFNNDLLKFVECMLHIYSFEKWILMQGLMSESCQNLLTKNFIDMMYCYYVSDIYFSRDLTSYEFDADMELHIPKKANGDLSFLKYIFCDEHHKFHFDLKTSTYLWMASHEYSHFLLGHLESEEKNINPYYLNKIDLDEILFEWKQEHDADMLGVIIALQSCATLTPMEGAYFALKCLLLSNMHNGRTFSKTHPPINLRIKHINNYLTNHEEYRYLGNSINTYKNFDMIFAKKYKAFLKFENHIKSEKINFSDIIDMQKYLYGEYNI